MLALMETADKPYYAHPCSGRPSSSLAMGHKTVVGWLNYHGEPKRLHKFYRSEENAIARYRQMICQEGPVGRTRCALRRDVRPLALPAI